MHRYFKAIFASILKTLTQKKSYFSKIYNKAIELASEIRKKKLCIDFHWNGIYMGYRISK